jgi:molecular chaperone HscB
MSKTSAVAAKALTCEGVRGRAELSPVPLNHFELLGIAPAFAIDLERLEQAYRDIQSNVHPDRFARAGDAERRASMEMTTRVNEAYRTLRSPVQRAAYLLALNGVDAGLETRTAMPREFLMEQMELRERLEGAGDADALGRLEQELFGLKEGLQAQIAECIDARHDYHGAADLVRKYMFLDRLDEDINAAYEALEA